MPFSSSALTFFRGLSKHNNKPWFEAHRADYERDVRDPMRALIEEMDARFPGLRARSPGDPKRSMFRINRDIRFSKDKSPYKTHAACWFNHRTRSGKVGSEGEGGSAGFYFHLAPTGSFVGAGIWMPPSPVLAKIRDALAENVRAFERIVRQPAVGKRYGGLDDEKVLRNGCHEGSRKTIRVPRGSSTSRLRSRTSTEAGRGDRPACPPLLESDFKVMLPFVRWLNRAMGIE